MPEWDEAYEQILRSHLFDLSPDHPITPETSLREEGLDSLETVELLVELENQYGIMFDDETLTMDTFSTAGSLWNAVHLQLPDLSGPSVL